jgi:ribosomal protein L29
MKRLDTATMDAAALTAFVTTAREEFNLIKRNQALGQDTNTARTKILKRDIARALTALNQAKKVEEK